jgi:hypothetical protein
MGMRWLPWPGQGQQREQARPRVARAVEAARLAQAGVVSVPRMASAARHFEAVQRAAATGPLAKVARRTERGLPQRLVLATARAAREAGRLPEEVWAEALGDWLALREETSVARLRTLEPRRQAVWHDIEETMRLLRAS